METTNQHKPGDIVNGHQLSEDGTAWVPVTAPTPSNVSAPGEPGKKNFFMRHKVLTGVAGVAALVVVGSALTGGGDASTTDPEAVAVEQGEEAAPAEAAPVEAAAAGIGDAVRDGKFEFTVTGVEAGVAEVGDSFLAEQAQGEYTLITMTVANIGDVPQTFFVDNMAATDSQGRELAADSMASMMATPNGSDVWISEINPGNSITVVVAFDLAPGETLTSVTLHDSAFSSGVEVSLV